MKTKAIICLFATAFIAATFAQAPATYTAVEAAQHIGETATVSDKVDGFHQSGKGNIFLNMGGRYPNQAFTAFIPSSAASNIPSPQQYEGKRVSVSGKIALYRGKPEIIVTSPTQLKMDP